MCWPRRQHEESARLVIISRHGREGAMTEDGELSAGEMLPGDATITDALGFIKQIGPGRVHLLDQSYFPKATPLFETCLARNSVGHREVGLEVDERSNSVPFGEASECSLSVSDHSIVKSTCHANVKCAVRLAR